jgi:hypothetical protein
MCQGCFNKKDDGTCALPWVSKIDQKIKAKSGFCEESVFLDTDSVANPSRQIKITGTWYTILENAMRDFFTTNK